MCRLRKELEYYNNCNTRIKNHGAHQNYIGYLSVNSPELFFYFSIINNPNPNPKNNSGELTDKNLIYYVYIVCVVVYNQLTQWSRNQLKRRWL